MLGTHPRYRMITPIIEPIIKEAVAILSNSGVIAYPTDTLFGIGADYKSEKAVERIVKIKQRDRVKGLPVLLATMNDMHTLARDIPSVGFILARAFWPGPLTLIVKAAEDVSDLITGGRGTIALRIPDHPVAIKIIEELGRPIIGTSANMSGMDNLLSAHDIREAFGDQIDYVVGYSKPYIGRPSTIIDLTKNNPSLLRLGALSLSYIEEVCGIRIVE